MWMIKQLLNIISIFLPWKVRRMLYLKVFGWKIDKSSRIGFSIILAKKVYMGAHAKIGHFNLCKPIDRLEIGDSSSIGNLNKITGFSTSYPNLVHFTHINNRKCELIIGKETGITSNHYFDCNGGIYIGDYVQIAGFSTAFMTHSIDIYECRQDAQPIHIGDYCFIGSRCLILKGVNIINRTVISAMSLINKDIEDDECLYGGVPAKKIKTIQGAKYFIRKRGFI